MKLAFRSEMLSSNNGNKPHLFSSVMLQPCCLKWWFLLDSYSRRSLKLFGWYGLSDTFTKTCSGGLSCVFVVSSLPAILVDDSKSFSFPGCSLIRIVSSSTPGYVSLVHGFIHDKSVAHLFSIPQARSQQQTEILIHFLKKLAPVNDISGVLYLVDPV